MLAIDEPFPRPLILGPACTIMIMLGRRKTALLLVVTVFGLLAIFGAQQHSWGPSPSLPSDLAQAV